MIVSHKFDFLRAQRSVHNGIITDCAQRVGRGRRKVSPREKISAQDGDQQINRAFLSLVPEMGRRNKKKTYENKTKEIPRNGAGKANRQQRKDELRFSSPRKKEAAEKNIYICSIYT